MADTETRTDGTTATSLAPLPDAKLIRDRLQNSVNWLMDGRKTGECVGAGDFMKLIEWLDRLPLPLATVPQPDAAEPAQCNECAGTGRVDFNAKVDNSGRTDKIRICCDACEGTGFTPVERPAAAEPAGVTLRGIDEADNKRLHRLEMIRATFLAHGFTIKEGQTDLKPYVYEAAEALLAQVEQPAANTVPATSWGQAIEQAVDEFLADYEMRGEDAEGRDGYYRPTADELLVIKDAIMGLMADDAWIAAYHGAHGIGSSREGGPK